MTSAAARDADAPRGANPLQAGACPSATKRLSELRRAGWRIDRQWIGATAADGRINAQTLYRLADADTAQADLFDPA